MLLALGSTGQDVINLQNRLNELGFNCGTADGKFGSGTVNSVKAFQAARNLSIDGMVGPQTWNILFGTGTSSLILRNGSRGNDVKKLQFRLTALNYFSGNADGIFGNVLYESVRTFQVINNLTVDGVAGPATLSRVYSSSAIKKPASTQTILFGSKGKDVSYLQTMLSNMGYMFSSITETFGRNIEEAVKAFQAAYNLKADGIVGPETWGKLAAASVSSAGSLFSDTLKIGSRGSKVQYLQNRLNKLGYNAGAADGVFGSQTDIAVRLFQSRNGLTVDGMVGTLTWNKIDSIISIGGYDTKVIIRVNDSGTNVKNLQIALNEQGYNCGVPDGIYGTDTANAIRAFQRDYGLSVDGDFGPLSWQKLNELTTNGSTVAVSNATLKEGSSGSSVVTLQNKLNSLGYNCGNADGIFGPNTTNAVRNFQSVNNLSVDGMVGPLTWNALYGSSVSDIDTSILLANGDYGPTVRKLQTLLNNHGYSVTVDGDFGPNTHNSVVSFQRDHGLNADGMVGPQTWSKLIGVFPNSGKGAAYPLLKSGNTGEEVRRLQRRLLELGYNLGYYGADAVFGSSTESSVLAFQRNNGLVADGIVGPLTSAALNSSSAKKATDTDNGSNSSQNWGTIIYDDLWNYTVKIIKENSAPNVEITTSDISKFVLNGKNKGITDDQVLIYFADLCSQGGVDRAKQVVDNCGGGLGLTLDKLHKKALTDSFYKENTIRRNAVYAAAKRYGGANNNRNAKIDNFVRIALAELGTTERPGNRNKVKYNDWWHGHTNYANDIWEWCAIFVSWCAYQAGILGDIVPYKQASVTQFKNDYSSRGRLNRKPTKPKKGDIFIQLENGAGHTGIVVSSTNSSYTTIEGNYQNKVAQVSRSLSDSTLTGFCDNGYTVSVVEPEPEKPATYGNFSKNISYPKTPQYIIDSLEMIEKEFNIWPAAEISNYSKDKGYTTLTRGEALNSIYQRAALTMIGGYFARQPDAATLMKHFLYNNGVEKLIDFKRMCEESEDVKNNKITDLNEMMDAAEYFAMNSQEVSFCSIINKGYGIEDNSNWHNAIGKYATNIKCSVRKQNNKYLANVDYLFYDIYDWDPNIYGDDSFDISIDNEKQKPVTQRDMWELQYGGLGKGFLVTGTYKMRVEWSKGQRCGKGAIIV